MCVIEIKNNNPYSENKEFKMVYSNLEYASNIVNIIALYY